MTTSGAVLVDAADVRVGDDLVFLGGPRRVILVTEHDAPASWGIGETYRTAHAAGGWAYSLIPGERVEVLRP